MRITAFYMTISCLLYDTLSYVALCKMYDMFACKAEHIQCSCPVQVFSGAAK